MNKKKIIVVGEPPMLTQLIMTPGFEYKDIFCLDDIRGSLPILLPPEINMNEITRPFVYDQAGTCCAAIPEVNINEMIETFKDLSLDLNPKNLVARDAFSFQVKFPRSKKNRVRKKWAKRPENYSDDISFGFGNNIVGHSRLINQFTRYMEFTTKQAVKEGFGFPGYGLFR
jgi:hypothetical protein